MVQDHKGNEYHWCMNVQSMAMMQNCACIAASVTDLREKMIKKMDIINCNADAGRAREGIFKNPGDLYWYCGYIPGKMHSSPRGSVKHWTITTKWTTNRKQEHSKSYLAELESRGDSLEDKVMVDYIKSCRIFREAHTPLPFSIICFCILAFNDLFTRAFKYLYPLPHTASSPCFWR